MPKDLEDSSIKFIPDIDHDLLAGLLRGEVVIFVGNGVSRLGGIPSWDDLATSFWKDCFDYNAYIADPVILHCTPQQIEQMQRMKVGANDATTVYERLTTYGIQIVSDTQKQLTTKELVAKLLQQYNFGGTIIIDHDELLKFV